MVAIQGVAEQHIHWVLARGSLSFWHDNWLGTGPLCRHVDTFQECAVSDFVEQSCWNVQRLSMVAPSRWVERILGVVPPSLDKVDTMVWAPITSGAFSLASAYRIARKGGNSSWLYSLFWLQGMLIKISFFMLRLIGSRLPVMDRLHKLGILGRSRCFCCLHPCQESTNHIFYTEVAAKRIWGYFEGVIGGFRDSPTARHKLVS